LTVKESGLYWLELTDREGLTTEAARGEIRAIADTPPTVSLDRPAAGLFATPSASVPIKAVVRDNLAICKVELVYSRTDKSEIGDQRIELFNGPATSSSQTGGSPISAPGDSLTIEDRWDLPSLNLPPGTQITFHIAADDYQPKTGFSTARKITIVTPAELEQRIAMQQGSILAELGRILKLERDLRSHTAGILEQISQVGSLPKTSFDLLQTAELNQRQVRRALASRTDGVRSQIAGLTAELESNRLDSPEITHRLQQMANTIEELENEPLPEIERELTTAVKESKALPSGGGKFTTAAIQASLKTADAGQVKVIAALEKLIDKLTEWDYYRGLARDLGQIRQEQASLQQQTQQVGSTTIALDAQNLSAQQRADLNNASRVQNDLAGRFSKLLTQMERIVQESSDDAHISTEAVSDALHIARQQNLGGRMRDSADQVGGNHIGQAIDQQTAVLRGMDEMLDTLANRREQELSRLIKKLRDAEKQLDDLRQQQDALQKKLERLTKESKQPGANQVEIKQRLERLQREQKRLQQETERLTRQLERLQAEKASKSTAGASNRMGSAGDRAAQNKPAEALDEATKAKQDLDEAQKQLAEQRRKAEQDLAHEQLAKIGDALKSLAERQGRIVDETFAYDAQRNRTTGFTRAQSQSVLDLSRTETGLSAESKLLAEKVAAAEVFHLALDRAANEMTQAAEKLAKLDTGNETQQSASEALHRLQQIVEALKRDPSASPPKPNNGGGGGGGNNQPPADKIALLAEVKLLKMMQEQVNLRTRELDEATRNKPMLTADQRREYIELAKEQGTLAELILKKSAPLEPLPEENPESLPDVRRDEETK
jgi:archaellum component FlaC